MSDSRPRCPSTLHPQHTAAFLLLQFETAARARGSREPGVLGVCRLTRAQAAICHPTLASLILILGPAWPSRPAVSSPQKDFLLGGVAGEGELGRQRHGGSCTARPFDPVPWPAGADSSGRQQRVYSLPPPPLFYQPHRPQGLTERQEGAGETDREKGRVVGQNNNEETDMVCADHLLFFLHSSLDTDLSIPLFSPL